MRLELPHTASCLVCGTDNPRGLHLSLFVEPSTGEVTTTFTPTIHHIGFQNIVHGGILITVADESMAWAAIYATKRLCLAGEVTTRFRSPARPGMPLTICAAVTNKRHRLIETACTVTDPAGVVIAECTAKFVPLPQSEYANFLTSLLPHPNVSTAVTFLRS